MLFLNVLTFSFTMELSSVELYMWNAYCADETKILLYYLFV